MSPDTVEPSPSELAGALEEFLTDHPRAALLEDGRILFDLPGSNYSVSTAHGRCVLHLWSEERNLIRTVVGLEKRKNALRILVRRLGARRPQSLFLVMDRDPRTPGARTTARNRYIQFMGRMLTRYFNDFKVEGLRSTMDLENSFGPAYARGMLARGQRVWAIIGVNAEEAPATVDGVLTQGILWFAYCRKQSEGKRVCHGLKVFVPEGTGDTARARMAWLNHEIGQWELYEVSQTRDEMDRIDTSVEGNLKMRLVQAFDPRTAMERAGVGLERIMRSMPEGMRSRVAIRGKSAHEVGLSLHGLEFARVRHGFAPDSFVRRDVITFGVGGNETPLGEETEERFSDFLARLFAGRCPAGNARDPLFRLQPEGWLGSLLLQDLARIEPSLQSSMIYPQAPAFAAGDRAILDLLTVTRGGRLAVVELKAEEDLHLPLQGLDYWIRVHSLHRQRGGDGRGELERSGYFPGIPLLDESPLLYFVAPALHIHPSFEIVLEHVSPKIAWTLIALNESWRIERTVVFRKHAAQRIVQNPTAQTSVES